MKQNPPDVARQLIRNRRSVYPKDYIDREIPKEIILDVLESADTAPTHKRTQPWRFIVFRGDGRKRLAEALLSMYRDTTDADKFLQKKAEDIQNKALRSGAVIMINVRYSGAVPAWEEVAATAAAVQNLWLAAASHGVGGYWSSPGFISEADKHFELGPTEECLGFFYMGYHNNPAQEARRDPLDEKIRWEENA